MRLQVHLLVEELTTASVGELDADAVTKNKILKLKLKDRMVNQLVEFLKKRKNTKVNVKGDVATINFEQPIPKEVMKKLSNYVV